ncbi:MAG: MetQ/NlpA family ABC transporter substrate-binding protein [Proteobacteria bacterium]|nr:MetQ/NlpA family ABC transporter substrate-binding protein [Pseudomonadota bacterium]
MKYSIYFLFWCISFFLGTEKSIHADALKVGVTAGPHALILEEIKKLAQKEGLEIKIVEFNDFILPNAALEAGDIDINSYQHQPFLEEQVKTRGYKLVSLAKTIILPMGIYSLKHKDLKDIQEGAKISIPNDPTNGGRALLLLKKAQLIDLKPLENPSVLDITSNPKNLKIVELEAPQIPRTLEDVDYGITNTDWITLAGMDPQTALLTEDKDSPYANLIVVRTKDKEREEIKKFIQLYQSQFLKDFIEKTFKGSVLPAW